MSSEVHPPPRIGIPYRTRNEEVTPGVDELKAYRAAVLKAGGTPVEISLDLSSQELKDLAGTLQGVVLSGSPADVEPALYRTSRDSKSAPSDAARERTDFALIEYALRDRKPLLAICYGIQSLNVVFGGTLIQDIPTLVGTDIDHDETFHMVQAEPDSRLAQYAPATDMRVNSSHHQSILDLGRDLRIVARAPDGVIEAVEWTGDATWLVGVQWHPERMVEFDQPALNLFRDLVRVAQEAPSAATSVPASGRHSA